MGLLKKNEFSGLYLLFSLVLGLLSIFFVLATVGLLTQADVHPSAIVMGALTAGASFWAGWMAWMAWRDSRATALDLEAEKERYAHGALIAFGIVVGQATGGLLGSIWGLVAIWSGSVASAVILGYGMHQLYLVSRGKSPAFIKE